jgi:hypothetical protein
VRLAVRLATLFGIVWLELPEPTPVSRPKTLAFVWCEKFHELVKTGP